MKRLLIAAALLVTSCGPQSLSLPQAPVDRAATCGVVAAAEARAATDIKRVLPFTAQLKILHYALLAGSEGESFSEDASTAVIERMPALQEEITEGKWQELAPACRQAFPAAEKEDVTLPSDRFDAQLGCDALGDFLVGRLRSQEMHYGSQLGDYRDMLRELDKVLGPGLRSRAGADLASQQEARREALAETVRLGQPAAIMRQCVERYG
jgi:hypothetical protein